VIKGKEGKRFFSGAGKEGLLLSICKKNLTVGTTK